MGILSALPIIGNIIGGPVSKIIDNLGEDDRREFERAMQRIDNEYRLKIAQIETNKAEAAHSSIFVAGWRPFVGWACGFVFIAAAAVAIFGAFVGMTPEQIAALSEAKAMMFPVLMGLLGLGGMRSFEKFKGVARENMK
ncbi:MAG: hypothetical protein ISN29_07480 [Gammaproteobacteria bacterium AqS3]|nr:hypothetical protein [Gammaproteobacteria bacterium AqS3]